MPIDTVVTGRALLKGMPVECCIGIRDGKISKVAKTLTGHETMDFGDSLLLPAAVDIHVHFREPGKEYKEDFFSGTMAAAFGGVSCVIDMPNTIPMTADAKSLREKHLLAQTKANVDYGVWGLLAPGSDTAALMKGSVGLKFYMSETTGTAGTPVESWPALAKRAGNALVAVHPEHPAELRQGKPHDLEEHSRLRPAVAEARAIKEAGNLFGNLHACHVSSKEGLDALECLRKVRNGGQLTAEVAPHHLLLNSRSPLGAMAKVNPPVRKVSDQSALWEALASGRIEMMATDLAPHTIEEKRTSFGDAPSGLPGVETGFPLMLKAVKDGRLSLQRCVEACCELPAQRVGAKKGKLEVGYDADIAVVHMRDVTKIRGEDLHSKSGWTPFEGMEAVFPKMVMVRGQVIVRGGSLENERCGMAIPISAVRK